MSADGDTDGLATVVGGAGWIFGGNVIRLSTLFLLQILMARWLGPDTYGGVVIALAILSLGSTLGLAGLGPGLVRNLPYYEDDPLKARGIVKGGFTISIVVSTLVGGTIFVSAPMIAMQIFKNPESSLLIRLAGIGIPFSVLIDVSVAVAKGARDARVQVVARQIIDPILRVIFASVLILVGFEAFGAVVGIVLSLVIGGITAVSITPRVLPFRIRGPTVPMKRELLMFSLPLVFATSSSFIIRNTDTFLLGVFLDSARVGTYNAAFRLQDTGMLFAFAATFLLPPVLTRLTKQGDYTMARRIYQIITKWSVFFTFPIIAMAILFPRFVISYSFGQQYLSGALSLQILMASMGLTILLGSNSTALIALGHNRSNLYVDVVAAGLNIALNIILIPWIGIPGAAIASAAAFFFRDTVFSILLYRWEAIQPFSKAMLKPLLIMTLYTFGSYHVYINQLEVTLTSVAGFVGVFMIFYLLVIIVMGGLESEDEQLLFLVESRVGYKFTGLRRMISQLRI